MDADALKERHPGHNARRSETASGSSVSEDAQIFWHELRCLIHGRLRLAALETQQAGRSLIIMIVAGVMTAVLLISAWLGLVVAVVLGLVERGVVASSAVLLAVVLNFVAALLLWTVIRRKSRYLGLPATIRSLRPRPQGHPDMQQS